jgi:hypothetical protein
MLRKKLDRITWNPVANMTTPGMTRRMDMDGSMGPKELLSQ